MEILCGEINGFGMKCSTRLSTTTKKSLPTSTGQRPMRRLLRQLSHRKPKWPYPRTPSLAEQACRSRMRLQKRRRQQRSTQSRMTHLGDSLPTTPDRQTEHYRRSLTPPPSAALRFHIPGSLDPYPSLHTYPPRHVAKTNRRQLTNYTHLCTPQVVRSLRPADPFLDDGNHDHEAGHLLLSRQRSRSLGQSPPAADKEIYFVAYDQKGREKSEIHMNLLKSVLAGPQKSSDPKQTLDKSRGYLYVMEREGSEGHVKLGSSVDPPRRRERLKLKLIEDHRNFAFPYFRFAESLVKEELCKERRKLLSKKPEHDDQALLEETADNETKKEEGYTEWFHIDQEKAKQICSKWRDWLNNHDPYYANGMLKGFWRDRFQRLVMNNQFLEDEQKSLHSCWSDLLDPPEYEKIYYHLRVTWSIVYTCCIWAWTYPRLSIFTILLLLAPNSLISWQGKLFFSILIVIGTVTPIYTTQTSMSEHTPSPRKGPARWQI